jgi:hypothetical protein
MVIFLLSSGKSLILRLKTFKGNQTLSVARLEIQRNGLMPSLKKSRTKFNIKEIDAGGASMSRYRLVDDPRFKLAAQRLNLTRSQMLGYLIMLQLGALSSPHHAFASDAELEATAEWDGQHGALARVLCNVGLVRIDEHGRRFLVYPSMRFRISHNKRRSVNTPIHEFNVARWVEYKLDEIGRRTKHDGTQN